MNVGRQWIQGARRHGNMHSLDGGDVSEGESGTAHTVPSAILSRGGGGGAPAIKERQVQSRR